MRLVRALELYSSAIIDGHPTTRRIALSTGHGSRAGGMVHRGRCRGALLDQSDGVLDCQRDIERSKGQLHSPGLDLGQVQDLTAAVSPVYNMFSKEGAKMPEYRIKVAPNTVAYADGENHKLVVEFAIPGAPTDTIDVKILADSVHLTAPARDIEYVASLALGWPVKPDKAEATYEHGLLRIEVPFKDPMEDAVKVAIKAGGAETKTLPP